MNGIVLLLTALNAIFHDELLMEKAYRNLFASLLLLTLVPFSRKIVLKFSSLTRSSVS